MREPIEFDDIRIGDTVECEWTSSHRVTGVVAAVEVDAVYSSGRNAHLIGTGGDKFLLHDRPKPSVKIPTTPTLGWIVTTLDDDVDDAPELAFLSIDNYRKINGRHGAGRVFVTDNVAAFVAATAVPTDALHTLRADAYCSGPLSCFRAHVDVFIAAVDAANGPLA